MFGRDRYRYSAVSSRLAVLEDKYVKATWFERISSGTSGSLSLPTGGAVVLDEWRAGIDAVTTKLDPVSATGYPTFVSAEEADKTLITATLDADGAWTISGTPSAYPIGIIYVYRVKLQYFDDTKSLGEVELSAGPMTVDTLEIVSVAAESSDVDKFLVDSGNVVKYRTGAQVLSDIGGLANIVEDTTPQLGGNLDGQNYSITTTNSGRFDGGVAIGTDPVARLMRVYGSTATLGVGLEIDNLGSADAIVRFALNSDAKFVLGVDNSVTGDPFKISVGSALGTGDALTIDSSGAITGGTYNALSIVPISSWIYLSGDGTHDEGLDIAIPTNSSSDFYYGSGGTEHHKFGNSSQVEISDDGLITALQYNGITLAVNDLVIDDTANDNSLTVSGDWTINQSVASGASPNFDGTNFTGIPSAGVTNNVSATANITDHAIVRGHGGAKVVQTSGIIIDDSDNVSGMGTLASGTHTITGGATEGLVINQGLDSKGLVIFGNDDQSAASWKAYISATGTAYLTATNGYLFQVGDVAIGVMDDYATINGFAIYRDRRLSLGYWDETFYWVKPIGSTALQLWNSTGTDTKLWEMEANGDMWCLGKLAFTQTDLNEYIDSLADGYMDYRATTAHRFGDGTNQLLISNTGVVTMEGTARATNAVWIDSSGLRAPPSQAATFDDHGAGGFGAWVFTDGAADTVVANMRIPFRMDRNVAPTFIVAWSTTPTSGNCEWEVAYLWRKVDEDTTAAVDDTLLASTDAGGTQAASTTAEGMVMTTFTLAAPHADDVCLHLRIRRRGDLAGDTIGDPGNVDVELHGCCMSFISNSLGG